MNFDLEDFDTEDFLLAFKAERTPRQDDEISDLTPFVESWLENFNNQQAFDDFVAEVEQVWIRSFQQQTRRTGYRAALREFREMMRESLGYTTDPTSPPSRVQVERIAVWAAVTAINSGAVAGFAATNVTRIRWITMHDSEVRSTHRAADNQTTEIGETFDIGGYALHYPGEPVGPPSIWINCRCVIAPAGRRRGRMSSYSASDYASDPDELDVEDIELDGEDELEDEEILPDEIPVHGVATIEGSPTGDGRMFAPGALTNRPLPLPLRYEFVGTHGGDTSNVAVIGRIDEMWREGNEYRYRGVIFPSKQYSAEALEGIIDGSLTGVSVEVDDMVLADDSAEQMGLGNLMVFSEARVCGFTMVPIPAYAEAYISLGPEFPEELSEESKEALAACGCDKIEQDDEPIVASALGDFAPGTRDGPGWITNPQATSRIRRYWVRGKGAAKIRWGVPGDFNRCRRQLVKYVQNPEWLAGLCANMHKEAIGVWPGQEGGGRHAAMIASGGTPAPLFVLAAANVRPWAPAEFFENPNLDAPTPIHVDLETGRVYGHAARWDACHIGIPGVCTTAPHSVSNYAYYRTGAFHAGGTEIPVGQITMDTGHAPIKANAHAAVEHYDHTGTVVADVTAGEDAYGIWIAGALRPDVDEDTARRFAASRLSGDWRTIGGSLEMIGLLAVNVPGFPIPRTALAASAEEQTALVAAGIVEPKEENVGLTAPIIAEISRLAVHEYISEQKRAERLEALRPTLDGIRETVRNHRIETVRAAMKEDE